MNGQLYRCSRCTTPDLIVTHIDPCPVVELEQARATALEGRLRSLEDRVLCLELDKELDAWEEEE